MGRYKCLNCDYNGNELVYQFNEYNYCVASNEQDPEFIRGCPSWVADKGIGEAIVGEPIGCPRCHAWGLDKFEPIRE